MSLKISMAAADAAGLLPQHREVVRDLVDVWGRRLARNRRRMRYYTGDAKLRNMGIALSPELAEMVDPVSSWPEKAVEALRSRCSFDGFLFEGDYDPALADALESGAFPSSLRCAIASSMVHGCAFATVTAGGAGEPAAMVCFHDAESASALWDFRTRRVRAGLTVTRVERLPGRGRAQPVQMQAFMADCVVSLDYDGDAWSAAYLPNPMGRPLMEAIVHAPTLTRPFGRSRITKAVMSITDSALREMARTEIASELHSAPQKYLLGASEDDFDMSKYRAYMDLLLVVSRDEDGELPQFGQLAQASMQPHVDQLRSLAAQFSAATDVPLSSLGVVSDNPSSAEAIYAAKEDLVIAADEYIADNKHALRNVALMAMAVGSSKRLSELDDNQRSVRANFANPAKPSLVTQADAMVKVASCAQWVAQTDEFLEEVGFTDEQRRSMAKQRKRIMANDVLSRVMDGAADG